MPYPDHFLITNACHEDYIKLHRLFVSDRSHFFGRNHRKETVDDLFLKTSVTHRIAIKISYKNPSIIGYAEVANAPDIPALPQDLWSNFLDFHYCCNLPLNATNTCFLNNFVFYKSYNKKILEELLAEIFHRDNVLMYIAILECPNYERYQPKSHPSYYVLEPFAQVFYPKCFSAMTRTNTQKLHVIKRDSILPKIRYRKALPEDNDDIVEMVNQDRPELKEQLGEYYIAEELLSNSKSLLVVTEINNTTAGFIWLNDNVNLLPLLENYNLQPFGNLLHFNTEKKFKEKLIIVSTAIVRPIDRLFTDIMKKIYEIKVEETPFHNLSEHSVSDLGQDDEDDARKLTLERLICLSDSLKSYDYYIRLRRREFGFYYNIPEGAIQAPFDDRLNVFVINLFGLTSSHDPRQIFRFLWTAFAAFPNKDYCLISLSIANQLTLPLTEMLKYFIRVIARPGCRIDQHLFIAHRSAVFGDLSLHPLRAQDIEPIKAFIMEEIPQTSKAIIPKRSPRSRMSTIADRVSFRSYLAIHNDSATKSIHDQNVLNRLLAILNNILEVPFCKYQCFTIRCGDASKSIDDNTIVGFVLVKPATLTQLLKKHFYNHKEEEFQNLFKSELLVLKLHPFFHFRADFIFRELARLSHFKYFYYFKTPTYSFAFNDLIARMQPIEPRRIKKTWFNYLGEKKRKKVGFSRYDIQDIDFLHDKFSVFINNLQPPTIIGNSSNIVVLGFNDICKAFLRVMIFSWRKLNKMTISTHNYLPRLDITVICAPGVMEADYEDFFQCKYCIKNSNEICWIHFKNSGAFCKDVTDRMDLRIWVKFVGGKVQTINNEDQLIIMQNGCEIYYETLLLMCGTEFGLPEAITKYPNTPANYSHINSRFDKILLYQKLFILQNDFPEDTQKNIIVYGCHVRAYECVNFLLKHGIRASEIHFVMFYNADTIRKNLKYNIPSEEQRIEQILREMIEDMGVQTYENFILCDYTMYSDVENLKTVSFRKFGRDEVMTLKCDLFISYYEVFLARSLLNVFNSSQIETEGNFVLVDETYQTSVNNVYAIGNFIKHRTEPNHQYRFVSPEEAAKKIVYNLRLVDTIEFTTPVEPKYSKPYYFQAQLPMEFSFVKVTSPKRYLANHLDNEYGIPLVTYHDGDFTRVRLSEHGMVEEIVVVTKKKQCYDFLKFFCGRHELLLNNLKARWYVKDIDNLLKFFQEPWTELIMHSRFEELRAINRKLISEEAKQILSMDLDRNSKRKLLTKVCGDIGVTSEMELTFLEFMRDHYEDFYSDIILPEGFPNIGKESDA